MTRDDRGELGREASVPGLPTILSSHAGLTGTSTT